jgi:hypothetical protein
MNARLWPRAPSAPRRRAVLAAGLALTMGGLGLGTTPTARAAPPGTETLGSLQQSELLAQAHPPVPIDTRITEGTPTSTLPEHSPTIEVRVGDHTYANSFVVQRACPEAIWLLVLDRQTLAPVPLTGIPNQGTTTDGSVVSICIADVDQAIGAINAIAALPGYPLVIVNTIWADTGVRVDPQSSIIPDIEKLGFTDEFGTVSLSDTSITGIGIPGLAVGQAWQVDGPASDDLGQPHTTDADLHGYLEIDSNADYHFVSLESNWFTLDPANDVVDIGGNIFEYGLTPAPGSGFHLLIFGRRTFDKGFCNFNCNQDIADQMYLHKWYDTSSAAGAANLADLVKDLKQAATAQFPEVVMLTSYGGDPLGNIPAEGPPPYYGRAILAYWVRKLGGTSDYIFSLKPHESYSLVAVPSTWANGVYLPGYAYEASPEVAAGNNGTLSGVLTVGNHNNFLEPSAISTSNDLPVEGYPEHPNVDDQHTGGLGFGAFQFQQLLAQRPQPWPVPVAASVDPAAHAQQVAAWAWWSDGSTAPVPLTSTAATTDAGSPTSTDAGSPTSTDAGSAFQGLCSCSDLRTMYIGDEFGGWQHYLDTEPYPGDGLGFDEANWEIVRDEIQKELDWATDVHTYQSEMSGMLDAALGADGTTLVGAWATIENELQTDENIDLKAAKNANLPLQITDLVLGVLGAIPEAGEAFSLASDVLNFMVEMSEAPQGVDTELSSTVADLAHQVLLDAHNAATALGSAFDMIYTDYYKLSTVGSALHSAKAGSPWDYDPKENGVLEQAASDNAAAHFYEALLPKFFEVTDVTNGYSDNVRDWGAKAPKWCCFSETLPNFQRYTDPRQSLAAPSLTTNAPGRYDLAAIGEAPMWEAGHIIDARPNPLTPKLLDLLTDSPADPSAPGLGIPLVEIYRHWGLHTLYMSGDDKASWDPVGKTYKGTCWTAPGICVATAHWSGDLVQNS